MGFRVMLYNNKGHAQNYNRRAGFGIIKTPELARVTSKVYHISVSQSKVTM